MTQFRSRAWVRSFVGSVGALAITGVLVVTSADPAHAVPPPPPNPSDQEIQDSENQASASAEEVGKLRGQLSSTQLKIQQLQDGMELKAELAMKARVDLEMAQQDARDAEEAAKAAQESAADAGDAIDEARDAAAEFAAASFRQGHVLGSMAVLVDVNSMDQLVARQQMIDQVSGSQRGVIANLNTALATKANRDSEAKAALMAAQDAQAKAEEAKTTADKAQADAIKSFQQGQAQLEALQKKMESQQAEYQAALNTVADLKSQREQYNHWQEQKQAEEQLLAEQAQRQAEEAKRLRDQKARDDKLAREAEKAKNAAVAKETARQEKIRQEEIRKEKERKEAERRAREEAAKNNQGGGSNGGTTSPPKTTTPPPPPSNGSKGQQVVQAALAYLGTTYAWGGGNRYGPTRGIHDGGIADYFGDYNKIGFDCSGLALYAWAQVGVYLPHYSAYQYNYGQHVSKSNLRAGDLVFFATNINNPATIHHVAIYMGNGQMVEAPQSGSYVRVVPLRTSGYIGATRPGT